MPLPSILDACRRDLLTPEDELRATYPVAMADRILRLREVYNMWMSNPSMKDRQLRDQITSRYGISQSAAYSDISVVHQIAPLLSQKSRDFHRLRFIEMSLETYNMAKARKDPRSMAQTLANYAKYLDLAKEDEMLAFYNQVPVQPFCASTDPTPLGIKAIPGIYDYIDRLTKDLLPDHPDMIDVEYEEVDLEEDMVFASKSNDPDKSEG